jgi:hypothetical protein
VAVVLAWPAGEKYKRGDWKTTPSLDRRLVAQFLSHSMHLHAHITRLAHRVKETKKGHRI